MISPKKLIRMAKKWQKLAARNRKRISFPRINGALDPESCSTSSSLSMAEKGHFAVYSAHQTRFMIPLNGGPIILPCDAVFIEYAISLIRRCPEKDVEKALLMSLATCRCLPSSYLHDQELNSQHSSLICSF
ncbi:hypothetical protein ACOSP7_031278 [Xanthoceras sorbifolium]